MVASALAAFASALAALASALAAWVVAERSLSYQPRHQLGETLNMRQQSIWRRLRWRWVGLCFDFVLPRVTYMVIFDVVFRQVVFVACRIMRGVCDIILF